MEPITTTTLPELTLLIQGHYAKATQGSFDQNSFTADITKSAEAGSIQPDDIISRILEVSKNSVSTSNNPKLLDFSEKMIKTTLDNFYTKKPKFQDILFFPSADNEIKFLNYLKLAKKSLRVCVFTISSHHIANCLRQAHEKGINVRIITDDEFVDKQGSDVTDLAREGIPVRTDENKHALMHNKFCVIDDEILITGSYNWTSQATYYNQENVVIIDNSHIVKTYSDHFDELWDKYQKFNLDKFLGTAIHKTKLYENFLKDEEKKQKHDDFEARKKAKEEGASMKIEKHEKPEVQQTAQKSTTKTTRKGKAEASSESQVPQVGEGSKKIKKQRSNPKSDAKDVQPISSKRTRTRKSLKEESLSEEANDDDDDDDDSD